MFTGLKSTKTAMDRGAWQLIEELMGLQRVDTTEHMSTVKLQWQPHAEALFSS